MTEDKTNRLAKRLLAMVTAAAEQMGLSVEWHKTLPNGKRRSYHGDDILHVTKTKHRMDDLGILLHEATHWARARHHQMVFGNSRMGDPRKAQFGIGDGDMHAEEWVNEWELGWLLFAGVDIDDLITGDHSHYVRLADLCEAQNMARRLRVMRDGLAR